MMLPGLFRSKVLSVDNRLCFVMVQAVHKFMQFTSSKRPFHEASAECRGSGPKVQTLCESRHRGVRRKLRSRDVRKSSVHGLHITVGVISWLKYYIPHHFESALILAG